MSEQFLNPKMTFIPPQKRFRERKEKAVKPACDCLGFKKVYVHGFWECEKCGKPDTK